MYHIRKNFHVYKILHFSENQIIENFVCNKFSVVIFRVIALNAKECVVLYKPEVNNTH